MASLTRRTPRSSEGASMRSLRDTTRNERSVPRSYDRIVWPGRAPNRVEVLRTSLEPHLDIVRVQGLASSRGWSAPLLVPLFVGKPLDDILDLQFIATSPAQSQKADGFVPITAYVRAGARQSLQGRARARGRGMRSKSGRSPAATAPRSRSTIARLASARSLPIVAVRKPGRRASCVARTCRRARQWCV